MKQVQDVRAWLHQREWQNRTYIRQWLLGDRTGFDVALHPPTGVAAAQELDGFANWLSGWRDVCKELPHCVVMERRTLRIFGEHDIPIRLEIRSIVDLAMFLGDQAISRLRRIMALLRRFEAVGPEWKRPSIWVLTALEEWPEESIAMLLRLLPQLHAGMGEGRYLRSVPLNGVDTKFVEKNLVLIGAMMDQRSGGMVSIAGGLLRWLGCLTKDTDQLLIRPLCEHTRESLGGFSKIWVTSEDLERTNPPGKRLLLVENAVSGLELPALDQTIAVIGCGGNLAWLRASWLHEKDVAYWGDIDSWGLHWLAVARRAVPNLTALMMDLETFQRHPEGVVSEDAAANPATAFLTQNEVELLKVLTEHPAAPARLEQEKLDRQWTTAALRAWAEPRTRSVPAP